MAFRNAHVVAQFAIDEATDTLLNVTNTPGSLPSVGIDPASFIIVTPTTTWEIEFDDDSEVPDLGRQVLTSETGVVVIAQGIPLIVPLVAPRNGISITITTPMGVAGPGANIMQVTVLRWGNIL